MLVGPYELVGRVSSSDAGAVWKGRDPGLFRDVALKQVSVPSAVQVLQIRSEATILASLHHEHIVQAYDLIEQNSDVWLVQEWVEGATLRAVSDSNAHLTPQQALGVMRGALEGLAYAHEQGVVHGDVAPGNILVDDQGVSKLVDFGLAGRLGQIGGGGTPGYASPEALSTERLLPASDVYSSGAVLAGLLQGHPLFGGSDAGSVLLAQRESPVLRGVHVEIRPVLERALATDGAERQQDAGVLLAELEIAAERAYGSGWWSTVGLAGIVGATMAAGVTIAAEAVSSTAAVGVADDGVSQVATTVADVGPVPVAVPALTPAPTVSHSTGVQGVRNAVGPGGAHPVVKRIGRSGSKKGLAVAGAGGAVVVVVAAVFLLKGGGSAGTAAPAGQSVATSISHSVARSATSTGSLATSATDPAAGAGTSVTLSASSSRATVSSRSTFPSNPVVPPKPVIPPNPALGFSGTYQYHSVLTSSVRGGEQIGRAEDRTWTVKTTCALANCKSAVSSSSGRKFTLTGKSGTWTDSVATTFDCVDSVTGEQTGQTLKGRLDRTLKVSGPANGRVAIVTGTGVDQPLAKCANQVGPQAALTYKITITFVRP